MIDNLKIFFNGFINRNGAEIMIATISARVLSFVASWIALQFVPNFELGLIIYAMNIISLIIPISGLGANQGLLRYGALLNTKQEKFLLFNYTVKKGFLISIFLVLIIILLSSLLTINLQESKYYLIAIAFSILTLFPLESLKVQFRVLHENKLYALTEITYNILLVILVFVLSYFFQAIGYVLAIILAPLITTLIYLSKAKFSLNDSKNWKAPNIEFWKYSFYSGLSNVASQLLVVLDIIMIGVILEVPEKITLYKYLALIPFSFLFLPRVFLTTDFVILTEKIKIRHYIKSYIKNYISLFSIISLFIITLSFIFHKHILSVFGQEFIEYSDVFLVLIIGISGILILRGLFGNLLSAMGKAYLNYWISLIGIIFNIISNYMLIPSLGILGAAITSSIIMWLTSILSAICFYHYFKKN